MSDEKKPAQNKEGVEQMAAKQYLQQIKTLEIKLKQKENQYRELKSAASGVKAIKYSNKIVSATKTADRLEKLVLQYISLEEEIERERFRLQALKQKIINEIQSLDNAKFRAPLKTLFKPKRAVHTVCCVKPPRKAYSLASSVFLAYGAPLPFLLFKPVFRDALY